MRRAIQTFFGLNRNSPVPAPASSSSLTPETKKSNAEQPTHQNQMARIPDSVFLGILAPMVELKEVKNISLASRTQTVLFRDPHQRRSMKENEKIHRPLFRHLARGEQAEVKVILDAAKNRGPEELIKLLTMKHTITDHAKRQFDNITLFQLALWYLDRHMWRMLLTYFKDEAVREALRGEAYRQYTQHQSGLTQYAKEHGQYYHFEGKKPGQEGIVTALQDHNDYLANTKFKRTGEQWAIADSHWKTGVGGAQSRAPLHLIQEYCREDGRNFGAPLPKERFKEENLPRAVLFYNWALGRWVSFWEGLTSGLGSSFGLYRGGLQRGEAALKMVGAIAQDLAANRRLCLVRIEEYEALEPELKKDCQALFDPAPEAASPGFSLSFSL